MAYGVSKRLVQTGLQNPSMYMEKMEMLNDTVRWVNFSGIYRV